jgi:hypothetical protein
MGGQLARNAEVIQAVGPVAGHINAEDLIG